MLKRVHRFVSLSLVLFWIVQVMTGGLLTFRWELDDAMLAGPAATVDPVALGTRLDALRRDGSEVSSMWASGGRPDRFDIFHARGGMELTTRVDGAGRVLRDRSDAMIADGGIWDTLTRVHQNLLAGEIGSWIVGVSGIVLASNIGLGLRLAWPARGRTRQALLQRPAGPGAARAYGWHRLVGLWAGVPLLALVVAGVLLVFSGGVERALRAEHDEPEPPAVAPADAVGPGAAMRIALARHPGATISGLSLPSAEAPRYRLRLNVPGETRRIYGATVVTLGADGRVIYEHRAREAGWRRWLVDFLYPFHTGQAGGPIGRTLTLALGLGLASIIALGVRLWHVRRRASRRKTAQSPMNS